MDAHQIREVALGALLGPNHFSFYSVILDGAVHISPERIYQHAYPDELKGGDLVRYLRGQKMRRKRYASGQERCGTPKNHLSIE